VDDQNTSVADAEPGSGYLLTSGSWKGEKSRSGSGMNILDHISESLETIFCVKILESFYAFADSGIFLTLDPGWKNSDPDYPQHCKIL
jgi:hypothetical protein